MQHSSGAVPDKQETAQKKRFGEWNKFLPILFVVCILFGLYFIYVWCHCLPMIQSDVPVQHRDEARRHRGVMELIIFHVITVLLIICYVLSILVHPGEIPANDPLWQYTGDVQSNFQQMASINMQETKKTGERRHCKWCGKYKPDRCHHCRVCRTCILKMDHHCPWIYNCVGFNNYKYFFLLLLYSMLDLHLIIWTMTESLLRTWTVSTPFWTIFFVLFGETLGIFLGVLVTMFFSFHVWLTMKAMTTIEFCEKTDAFRKSCTISHCCASLRFSCMQAIRRIEFCEKRMPKGSSDESNYDASVYDLGPWGNVRSVLGNNVFTWWLPCEPPSGDGLNYVTDETRLTKDLQAGKGARRKIHQKVQRLGGSRMGSRQASPRESRNASYSSLST